MQYETRVFSLPIKLDGHWGRQDVTIRAEIDLDAILRALAQRAAKSKRGLATLDSGNIKVKVVKKEVVR